MTGSINAIGKVEIWPNGSMQGDVVSPTVTIAEGATFRGSIDMPRETAEEPSQVAEQLAATADAGRSEEKPHRRLETEIPVPATGAVQPAAGTKPKDASHAA